MNYQKGFANIIVIIIAVVVLVGAAGYFTLVKKTPEVAQQTNTPPPTQTGSPNSPTPNPTTSTANWKTYKNTEYGLELKYPPTWKVQEKVTGFGFWINPPDFKMPSSGTVNPYFSFDVTAHKYLGD